MEIVIVKWKTGHSGWKYTMHFAASANLYDIFCAVDAYGPLTLVEGAKLMHTRMDFTVIDSDGESLFRGMYEDEDDDGVMYDSSELTQVFAKALQT